MVYIALFQKYLDNAILAIFDAAVNFDEFTDWKYEKETIGSVQSFIVTFLSKQNTIIYHPNIAYKTITDDLGRKNIHKFL